MKAEKTSVVQTVSGLCVRGRVRSLVIQERLRAPQGASGDIRASGQDGSWMRCSRHVLPGEASRADLGHTGEITSQMAWNELEKLAGKREAPVIRSLVRK